MMDIVDKTWEELGFKIRPLKYWVFIRTEPLYQRSEGGVWLPPKTTSFFGNRMAHQVLVKAVVCSAGPVARDHYGFGVGQRIVFKRLHFAHLRKMEDGTYFGWISAAEIVGTPKDEDAAEEAWLRGEELPPPPMTKEEIAEYSL